MTAAIVALEHCGELQKLGNQSSMEGTIEEFVANDAEMEVKKRVAAEQFVKSGIARVFVKAF